MAATNIPPRFFKVFISHFSSDSMMIPLSYYDELPRRLPKTASLYGNGGCVWNVAMTQKRNEVHFGQGWSKFVKDNSLSDGDFLTFVYDGDCVFEVSIYGPDGCKETRAVSTEVADDEEEDIICSLSTEDTETSSESAVPRVKNKGKTRLELVKESSQESDDEEDSVDFPVKKVVEDSDEDEDNDDYNESFSNLGDARIEKNETSRQRITSFQNHKLTSLYNRPPKKLLVVESKIKNPEAYLDNPNNAYFETSVKNRIFELVVPGQVMKDYCLKFPSYIDYIDNHKDGNLPAKIAIWKDGRVTIKKWSRICERNKVKKENGILCELFRERGLVHAIKIHIVREKDL